MSGNVYWKTAATTAEASASSSKDNLLLAVRNQRIRITFSNKIEYLKSWLGKNINVSGTVRGILPLPEQQNFFYNNQKIRVQLNDTSFGDLELVKNLLVRENYYLQKKFACKRAFCMNQVETVCLPCGHIALCNPCDSYVLPFQFL